MSGKFLKKNIDIYPNAIGLRNLGASSTEEQRSKVANSSSLGISKLDSFAIIGFCPTAINILKFCESIVFRYKWRVVSLLGFMGFFYLFGFGAPVAHADDIGRLAKRNSENIFIREKQILEVNKSLKNLIEENQKLIGKNINLKKQIKRLKSENTLSKGHYEGLKKDRDGLSTNLSKIRMTNRRYSKKIKRLEKEISGLEVVKNELTQKKIEPDQKNFTQNDLNNEAEEESLTLASVTGEGVKKREIKTMDLLAKIDAFTEEDERLKMDAAKAHYNMGNIYFQKGEYETAAREYYQAVTLMPDDPDVHYNLAFVSGEYLKDYKSALKHYKMYLYLSPQAKDKEFVRKQVLRSELKLRSVIDSPLEKEYK